MTSEPIARLDEILLDTGPFCRFCDAGALDELATYVDELAFVTQDVANEIHYRGKREHAALRTLQWRTPPFPRHQPILLRGAYAKQAALIHARKQRPGDPPEADLGEITTVIAAVSRGCSPVMIDDRFGRALASQRCVPLYSTADLAAEMTAAEALDDRRGWRIYRSVFGGKRRAFDDAVKAARSALA